MFIPDYRPGEMGQWRIDPGGQLITEWGYVSKPSLMSRLPSLLRREDGKWAVWMSLTPHEIESQELCCRYTEGHVVVMGLGMGWVAANVALRSEVERVTIIEMDPDVISLFEQSGALDSLPGAVQEKIKIVSANALEWRPQPGDSVDFLYVDIWLSLAEPQVLEELRQMQGNIGASAIYFWGQEIFIASAIEGRITQESVRTALETCHCSFRTISITKRW